MSYPLKQSSTAKPLLFFMTDSSDHITGKTGLSPTVTISKNGGSFGSPAGAVSEIANGWYKVAGNATDTNTLGPIALHATGTGADPDDRLFPVVVYDPDDAVRLGLTALPNANAGANGGLPTGDASARVVITPSSVQAVWDALLAALTTPNSIGAMLADLSTEGELADATRDAILDRVLSGNHDVAGSLGALVPAISLQQGIRFDGVDDAIEDLTDGSTPIPWNAAWDAEVQSEVQDAIEANRLDELLAADSDIDGAAPPTVGSVFHELMSKTAGSFTYDQTTDSNEAIRDRGDAAWITATSVTVSDKTGFSLSGTQTFNVTGNITGNLSGSVGSVTGNVGGNVTGSVGSVAGAVGSVTGNVGGNVVGTVASVVGAVGSVTGNVGGNVTGSVGSVVGAVGSVSGAVGSVTGNVGGNVTGSVGSIATGGIASASFAEGAINAAAIATDALGSLELSAGAANEVATALLDLADGVETGFTVRQVLRGMAAVMLGKSSSDGAVYRDLPDTKARVTAVLDDDGNRVSVSRDLT